MYPNELFRDYYSRFTNYSSMKKVSKKKVEKDSLVGSLLAMAWFAVVATIAIITA